jgi:UDP-N-acetylglucosamine 2-epimerase (non-hydrolysing)/GDP/UDP-N,N'-diacetylbacillosamine 2-epimerase (hydrolysing)
VISVEADADAIRAGIEKALSGEFRQSLAGMENLYGDGHAAERIAGVLAGVPLGEELLIKR